MLQFQRHHRAQLEVRDKRRICFYACVFNAEASISERNERGEVVTYREVIRPGAFHMALASDAEVYANIDHDNGQAFALRSTGDLLLQEDPYGLFCSCWIPETELGDSIIKDVDRGNLNATSFRFGDLNSRTTDGVVERLQLSLFDVCLTNHPAYKQTQGEVHLRSDDSKQRIAVAKYRLLKLKA